MDTILPVNTGTDALHDGVGAQASCTFDDLRAHDGGGDHARGGTGPLGIPAPRAVLLIALGTSFVGWLRARRILV